jgi:hypothetical protein
LLKTGSFTPAGSGETIGSPVELEGTGGAVVEEDEIVLVLVLGLVLGETAGCCGHPIKPTTIDSATALMSSLQPTTDDQRPTTNDYRSVIL